RAGHAEQILKPGAGPPCRQAKRPLAAATLLRRTAMFEPMLTVSGSLFNELDRLQRTLTQAFAPLSAAGSIRPVTRAFPALNIGTTPEAIEVYAFVPGVDASKLEVVVDRGLLTLSGERPASVPAEDGKSSVYANERF